MKNETQTPQKWYRDKRSLLTLFKSFAVIVPYVAMLGVMIQFGMVRGGRVLIEMTIAGIVMSAIITSVVLYRSQHRFFIGHAIALAAFMVIVIISLPPFDRIDAIRGWGAGLTPCVVLAAIGWSAYRSVKTTQLN